MLPGLCLSRNRFATSEAATFKPVRMSRNQVVAFAFLSLVCASAGLGAQSPAPAPTRPGATGIAPSDTSADARIIREIRQHQTAVRDVQHLSDVIGPRLTGSEKLIRAHTWAESTLTARGFTNVHREAYDFGRAWTRGNASARLLTQNGAALTVAGLAWGPQTPGVVTGDALLVTASTMPEFEAYVGQFKNRIVLIGQTPEPGSDTAGFGARFKRVMQAIRAEGATAILLSAGKSEGLTMTGGPEWRLGILPQIPIGFMASKDYDQVKRSLELHERVTLQLDLPGTLSPKPVKAYNTIAELRGSEWPSEVVILGAHLDSWDLGTGATDNGTGVASVMEALRAIKAAGLTPRRTIRVVLFTGEEQGHFGSKAYVKDHASEMDNVQAVLVGDLGTGRIRGFALQGREDARPFMAMAIAPLNELGVNELPLEKANDSDHASFTAVGVPAFFAVQDTLDYFSVTHHSQYDTFDHVKPAELVQGATALAVTAWELANMPARLPHETPRETPHTTP